MSTIPIAVMALIRVAHQKAPLRRMSTETESEIDTWAKINERLPNISMQKAEHAVNGVRSDVSSLRSEVKADSSLLNAEINQLKNKVDGIQKSQDELYERVSNIDNSIKNSARIIIGGLGLLLVSWKGLDYYLHNYSFKPENFKRNS